MKRSIDTSFWDDNYIIESSMEEKLLFLFLLSNNKTNMLGVYQIHVRMISFLTQLSVEDIFTAFERFERDNKASYIDGHVVMHNWTKHQKYNDNMRTSAISDFESLPKSLQYNPIVRGLITDVAPDYASTLLPIELNKPINNPLIRVSEGSETHEKGFEILEVELELELEEELEVDDEDARVREESSTSSPRVDFEKKLNPIEKQIQENQTAAREFSQNKMPKPVEELAERYLKMEEVVESICMRYSMDPPTLESWLRAFVNRKIETAELTDTWQNFSRHFPNWLKKQDLNRNPRIEDHEQSPSTSKSGKKLNGFELLAKQLESIS